VTGASAIGNTNAGVRISSGAHDNTIGGDSTAGEGNVISANGSDGVFLVNATTWPGTNTAMFVTGVFWEYWPDRNVERDGEQTGVAA